MPGLLVLHDRADQVPGRRVDAAGKRPAAGDPITALDLPGAAARKDQRRADQIVRRLAPDLVLRLFRPHAEHPVMSREVGQYPGRRTIALADHRDQLDDRAERQFAAADPFRLQDAEEAGAVQVLDRLLGQLAQFLGVSGALAQDRHERFGAGQELGEIGRSARLLRLAVRHRDTSFLAGGWRRQPARPRHFTRRAGICLRRGCHHRVAPA